MSPLEFKKENILIITLTSSLRPSRRGFFAQLVDRGHVLRAQVEVEDREVALDALFPRGFRKDPKATLDRPSEHHLRRS